MSVICMSVKRKIKKVVISALVAATAAGILSAPIKPEPLTLNEYTRLISLYNEEIKQSGGSMSLNDIAGNEALIIKMNQRLKERGRDVDDIILKMEGGRVINKVINKVAP